MPPAWSSGGGKTRPLSAPCRISECRRGRALLPAQPVDHRGEDDAAAKDDGELVEAAGQGAPVLDPVQKPLHDVALLVVPDVEGNRAVDDRRLRRQPLVEVGGVRAASGDGEPCAGTAGSVAGRRAARSTPVTAPMSHSTKATDAMPPLQKLDRHSTAMA